MNIINIENITKSYTERKLFEKASFYVQEREKIGIVGINGTGKSTLLKIIAGAQEPESGTVTMANHIVVNYLPQDPVFDADKTILENVMQEVLGEHMHDQDHWTLESDAKNLLMRLQLANFEQKTGELSGGQRKRLALVCAVLKPCDVLILDEPTNHLDYDMVEWLEDFLKKWRGALIMVTHDRYFLDSVCNRIVEIDKGSIYSYECNYSGFLERKAQREDSARASERKRQSILRKEIEWMQRGARARSTKQKAHIQRYEALRDQKGPQVDDKLELSSISSRLGRTTVEITNVSKAYGDLRLFKDFSYVFLKNDRIGFVGKNGCGKTTLMKMIAGLIAPDSGEIVVGQTVKIGYYSQEIMMATDAEAKRLAALSKKGADETPVLETAFMDPKQNVIDYIKDTAEYVKTEDGLVSASAMLERFLFPPSQQYSQIEKLSGGERRRLNLLRVLMEAPNVLILDEPTNDLDTETLAILEDYLDNYDGIVITVSHDRYFLDRIVRRIFAFEDNGKIVQYEGGYTDYLQKRPETVNLVGTASATTPKQTEAVDSKATWGHEKKLKFTFKEQKEYETIEADIEALETKISELEASLSKYATDFVKLNEITKEKEQAEAELETKMERWEYLEDLAAKIAAQ